MGGKEEGEKGEGERTRNATTHGVCGGGLWGHTTILCESRLVLYNLELGLGTRDASV